MKLILLADVKGLGKANDLVDVNDGYGRNYPDIYTLAE